MAHVGSRESSIGVIGQERRERRTRRWARDAVLVERRRQHAVSHPCRICVAGAERAEQRPGVEKRRLCLEASSGRVAGPWPACRRAAEPCSNRVEGDVARELEQVAVVCDQPRSEAALVQVTRALMALVERLGGACSDPVHRAGEAARVRCHEQMRVVREKAPCMAAQSESRDGAFQQRQRSLVVLVVHRHDGTSHTTDENMMHRARVVESQGSRHRRRFAEKPAPTHRRSSRLCTIAATLGPTSATSGSGSATWGQTPPRGVRPQSAG